MTIMMMAILTSSALSFSHSEQRASCPPAAVESSRGPGAVVWHCISWDGIHHTSISENTAPAGSHSSSGQTARPRSTRSPSWLWVCHSEAFVSGIGGFLSILSGLIHSWRSLSKKALGSGSLCHDHAAATRCIW